MSDLTKAKLLPDRSLDGQLLRLAVSPHIQVERQLAPRCRLDDLVAEEPIFDEPQLKQKRSGPRRQDDGRLETLPLTDSELDAPDDCQQGGGELVDVAVDHLDLLFEQKTKERCLVLVRVGLAECLRAGFTHESDHCSSRFSIRVELCIFYNNSCIFAIPIITV